ncbi:MAG: aspartate aminotransferase family protein [Pedosphaera sp.]|nr:aspartate aminotransferase family protein [Pedosphaera sp.]
MTGHSKRTLETLRNFESRNVTFIDPDGSWPIVWERAQGTYVWDADGRRYLDLTAAFGVAAAGHANRRVVRAGQRQMPILLHAMGDVHPHPLKGELAKRLSELTFGRWTAGSRRPTHGKVILGNSGFEAVEAALKTARLATGRPGVIAFEGGYHGLGYGALNTTHRGHFRDPFRDQLREFGFFVPFPTNSPLLKAMDKKIRHLAIKGRVGAILVEPIQARGGIRVPVPGFLKRIRQLADDLGCLLILDEIYTGFGRTGSWFATEHSGIVPDLICLGKGLTGGFPLSACVGRADLMDEAWPESTGEAIHTSTFLGHPVGCAMALAQIAEIQRRNLVGRAQHIGDFFRRELVEKLAGDYAWGTARIPGVGLMLGVELVDRRDRPATELALRSMKSMLQRGFILLPEGEHGNVLALTPPLTISRVEVKSAIKALSTVLRELEAS